MPVEHEVSITVRVDTIRDGTHGITLTTPDKLLGELPDSRAALLSLKDDLTVCIYGKGGDQHYLLAMPGTPIRGKQISDTEAVIVVRL